MSPLYGGIMLPGQPDLENIRRLDLLPMPCIHEMMARGMAIDIPYLNQLSTELTAQADELRVQVCSYIPPEKLQEFMENSNLEDNDLPMNVDSRAQLADLLFSTLGIGRNRELKLTKSGDRISTGKKQLEQLKRLHPVVINVLDYNELMKLKSTYTDKLPSMARYHRETDSWRVFTEILSTRTATGRMASKNPNLQNISVRTKNGRKVRQGFIPSPGMVLVGCDFSQIEMRLGAHYSGDDNLIRIFSQGLDPHTDTAKRAFKTETPDKLTQRDPCKNVNFGVFYGLGPPGLYDLMAVTYGTAGMELPDWLTVEWCEEFIAQWFELYPDVKKYIEKQHYRARRYGAVWDLFGRVRLVPETRSVHRRIMEAGLRQGGNMPIQATCAELMKLAIAEIYDTVILPIRREGVECWPLMTIHDEMLVEVEARYGELVKCLMEEVMGRVLNDNETCESYCRVPIKADGKVMTCWQK